MTNLMSFAKRFKHRAYVALPSLLAVSALFLSLESSQIRAQPVDGTQTLVFLRHAEKPEGGLGQLNCQGLNRAIDLSTLLPEKFGKADYVFAANPTRNVEEGELDNSYSYIRPLMTISPAAIKLGLPVNIEFSANDTSDLARELTEDKYHNSTIYTAWSHGYLPELINKVAGKAVGEKQTITDDWASGDFDSLYVLTLTWHNGKASLQSHSYKQGLDNGKATCPT
ncbi:MULTISPECIES: histidine phosphatase family protein [unclassified Pseudomonas]|uniref:histidine phosphatase family protein n=1 Tax=unclassified Pseudomonas TaxID=196821 RepID=UPI000CD31427|nr:MULTISPECIES: histidine phosphatase family protein [unclassified Pseudomonas]POA18493.1 histidine phosphatase family protein [Pseudomonas sp. FW305-3-2-15-E-TSA4]POA30810.1 histidine phosphatase family protein [Pseudomonas sp. FW305-3-2-15-E-TSA2]